MSLYTTPLQLGYFFSLLLWLLFLIRGYREQRNSDSFLGWIMFILAMELQDYTFGFAGINFLWNEMNGFPRSVGLLFGPVVYFYFKSQVNRSFKLKKHHFWHFAPYLIYISYDLFFFLQGPEGVQQKIGSTHNLILSYVYHFAVWGSYVFYLTKCLNIYKAYRKWSLSQFSNEDLISFRWFRNFIYAMIFWLVCREIMGVLDGIYQLDFYQDWWWNLALVAVVFYIGLTGYSQAQPAKISFETDVSQEAMLAKNEPINTSSQTSSLDKSELAHTLQKLMQSDRLYLQADLSLQELAQHLDVNTVHLSATINHVLHKNFNDYINELRIEEFIKLFKSDKGRQFTMLSIALDSGFNSKATFNRAFKKIKGCSPKEYLSKF
jgi:AraC-like DNA-binding protein